MPQPGKGDESIEMPEDCGSCYGAKGPGEKGCCNTCRDLADAYNAMGWALHDIRRTAEQVTSLYVATVVVVIWGVPLWCYVIDKSILAYFPRHPGRRLKSVQLKRRHSSGRLKLERRTCRPHRVHCLLWYSVENGAMCLRERGGLCRQREALALCVAGQEVLPRDTVGSLNPCY